ncbi:MAG TPA: PH domain-containing protein [Candidatus Acidoferrales bacterium]|nr:PH domain-containing protein [Candidatus Acidoferrales bacterium]
MTTAATALDTLDTPNLRRLSPRFWVARQCQIALFWGPVLIVALVVAFVTRVPAAPLVPVVIVLMAIVAWLVERGRFRSWGYAEREDDLIVVRGLLFRRVSVVPYGRMQFIDVTAGPIDRAFGLATVQLHTAAAASDARIPGLVRVDADALRDRLATVGEAKATGL